MQNPRTTNGRPYIRDPGPKKTDHHRSPTTRVLLDCRQLPPCDSLPAGASGKKTPDPHQARPHMFYSTTDNCHTTTVCPPGLPAKKRQTRTQARPHEFCSTTDNCHTTTVWVRALPGENDPWRFRQQSSRVISIQFWYLTSWLPRFL